MSGRCRRTHPTVRPLERSPTVRTTFPSPRGRGVAEQRFRPRLAESPRAG
ncbi:hypothetical protein ACFFX0_23390 [Citricoccus parietis]|uniref:Uncharacterized protein n=1 Tax=Citricoccus parietis TaxID=592307 RepID=A0ABV5G4W6_9MICC